MTTSSVSRKSATSASPPNHRFQVDEAMKKIEKGIKETKANLKKLTEYAVAWFVMLAVKYGKGIKRKQGTCGPSSPYHFLFPPTKAVRSTIALRSCRQNASA
jgi:hypothetical protein